MPTKKREAKPLYWIVKILFDTAEERGIRLQELEKMVWEASEKAGEPIRIPFQSMRYWRYGYSAPKITEVHAIAEALGMELELMDKGNVSTTSMRTQSGGEDKGG